MKSLSLLIQDEKNQLLITNIWLKLVSYGNKLLNVITNILARLRQRARVAAACL